MLDKNVLDKNVLDKGILIVEDEYHTRQMLAKILSEYGFNNLYQAENVAQCLSILSEHGEQIYLVLLDIMLPDGFGLSVVEYLVNSHSYIVGIIVITGFGTIELARDFFALGTDTILAIDFQQKPLRLKTLLEQINRALKLIDTKRKSQSVRIQNELWRKLDNLEAKLASLHDVREQLTRIEEKVERIEKHFPSFLKEIGMDVVRLVIIGLAVFAFLYLDLGSAIVKIIEQIK